jgi:hypothetical protein
VVFSADCRAAVSAPSSLAPVPDPTMQPSMALSIVARVEYFGSTTTIHPPCINTCLASLASPPLRIIYTPPCLYICLVSLAPPPLSQIIHTPRLDVAGFTTAADFFYSAMDSGNQRGDGVPNMFPPWPGCLTLRACMCTDEAPSTPASYTMTRSPSRLPPMCA